MISKRLLRFALGPSFLEDDDFENEESNNFVSEKHRQQRDLGLESAERNKQRQNAMQKTQLYIMKKLRLIPESYNIEEDIDNKTEIEKSTDILNNLQQDFVDSTRRAYENTNNTTTNTTNNNHNSTNSTITRGENRNVAANEDDDDFNPFNLRLSVTIFGMAMSKFTGSVLSSLRRRVLIINYPPNVTYETLFSQTVLSTSLYKHVLTAFVSMGYEALAYDKTSSIMKVVMDYTEENYANDDHLFGRMLLYSCAAFTGLVGVRVLSIWTSLQLHPAAVYVKNRIFKIIGGSLAALHFAFRHKRACDYIKDKDETMKKYYNYSMKEVDKMDTATRTQFFGVFILDSMIDSVVSLSYDWIADGVFLYSLGFKDVSFSACFRTSEGIKRLMTALLYELVAQFVIYKVHNVVLRLVDWYYKKDDDNKS